MTRKRKPSKQSPDNGQTTTNSNAKKANKETKENKMAQNVSCTPGHGQSGQNGQLQAQASQSFNYSQMPNAPMGQFIMSTPAYQGQSFMSQLASPISPNHDILATILDRLNSMDNKLSQLEKIQSSVSAMNIRIDKVDKRISDIESRITEVEKSCEFSGSAAEDISNKQKQLDTLLKNMKHLTTTEDAHVAKESKLQAEVTDLKCRSMRDNLLFFRIPEEQNEICENTILDFIVTKLHIENAKENIKIHRAHRVGAFRQDKVRPIVAKFAFFPDKEKVRKAANQLKGTPFGIAEQYPPEVMEKRRKLVPIMKAARAEGKLAYITVDRLFINKRLYVE